MKLIGCYIENFGKLTGQRIHFSKGCQCFCHENGWGKSTLAAFLTVMLYGFEKERSRDDYTNERKRYRPWQGGIYGGTLTFEVDGKQYTVERTFGLKEKEDFFLLRDEETNLETKQYSSNLGEEIFGLDRDSFERTIFMSQKDCSTRTTDHIQARLGNLAEATDDMYQYDKADEKLHNLLNTMSPHRKTGSLYRLKEQIEDLEAELRRGEFLDKEIESLIMEKRQTEENDKKYKKVQELLLKQQSQISLSINNKREELKALQKSEEREALAERENRNIKSPHLFFLAAGMIMILLGAYLLLQDRTAGIGVLVTGTGVVVTAFFQVYRKKTASVIDFEEHNNTLIEQKKSQIEKKRENQIEEKIKVQLEEQMKEARQRLEKIQKMMEMSYRKKVHLEQAIQEKRKKKERLIEKEEQLHFLKEQYTSEQIKYERFKMTKEYLKKARESYLAKYKSPLMHSFSKYYEYISGEEPEHLKMDANLCLTVCEAGIQREARYYSEGFKDLFGICMRMALVEVMYQKEKPFLILDDPFVNLDQLKTQAALDFIKELGEEYQILYFTCHESRMLEK